MRQRSEKIQGNTTTLAGWSAAAYGDQSSLGKCRLGYAIGVMSSTLSGPCHITNGPQNSLVKLAKKALDHMSMFRELYGYFLNIYPGLVGPEDCESLFTHLKNRKAFADKSLARHFLAIQRAIELKELDKAYWLPGQ